MGASCQFQVPAPLHHEKSSRYPLDRRFAGTQRRYRRGGEENKSHRSRQELNLGLLVRSLVTSLTDLSCLNVSICLIFRLFNNSEDFM
jgi:hypothetical protein